MLHDLKCQYFQHKYLTRCGSQGHPGDTASVLPQFAEFQVVWPEVMTPLGHAVCFVYHEVGQLPVLHHPFQYVIKSLQQKIEGKNRSPFLQYDSVRFFYLGRALFRSDVQKFCVRFLAVQVVYDSLPLFLAHLGVYALPANLVAFQVAKLKQ